MQLCNIEQTIETHARAFFMVIILSIARVPMISFASILQQKFNEGPLIKFAKFSTIKNMQVAKI